MIRVLHIGKFYPPARGGMERVLEALCQSVRGRVESSVLAFNTGRQTVREDVDRVAVTRVGTIGSAGSVPIAPSFAAEIRRARADVIVLHEPNPWALLSYAVARPRVPLAIWFHSEVVRPQLQYALFYHPLAQAVYGRAARVIVSSPDLGRHAAALAPYQSRVVVVPFGIDPSPYVPSPDVSARVAQLRAQSGSAPRILYAGRMVPYKGVDVLLRALAGSTGEAVLVGDGPSRPGWMQLARDLGLEGRVTFAGEVQEGELTALYHACDVFVLPSVTRAEAFGYVQLEAMACGKPVVSTRLPSGVPWVNRDGETGLTVPPGDVGALRNAIDRLVSDRSLRTRMGMAACVRVRSEFSIERMGNTTAALYNELATGARG
ncbi:MAG: glycosyltransferase [Acidobacteria bacterium]|nr:glycosyltransferase [Acidobacteriota bacterium]MCA1649688.1 glycosyltransferase [Acidobacteriota bacterium]